LFKENTRRPEARPHRAADTVKPGAIGNHLEFSFPVQEDEIIVRRIDAGEGTEQEPEVNLSASDAARDEKQSVNADSQRQPAKPWNRRERRPTSPASRG
jgi:hypothetical protein